MLSPLRPLLCRHDYFWSERDQSERCRRCGKLTEAAPPQVQIPFAPPPGAGPAPAARVRPPEPVMGPPVEDGFLDIPVFQDPLPARRSAASDKVLKAQAKLRREALLTLLARLAEGRQQTREEAIDAVLAVMEDAHSAEPVVFGADAAAHFARLHKARAGLIF